MMTLTNPSSIVTVERLHQTKGFFDAFAMLMPALANTSYASISTVDNPEFYDLIIDAEDKIIAGVRRDMTYEGLGTAQAVEAIIAIINDINNA